MGVEVDDIQEDDSFFNDLHMSPIELTDFLTELGEKEVDTSQIDLTKMTTVGELLEALDIEN